jgi:hypothetical protein
MSDIEAITEAISVLSSMESSSRMWGEKHAREGNASWARLNLQDANRHGMTLAVLHRVRAEMIDRQRAALAAEQSAFACRSAGTAKSPSGPATPA